MTVAELKEMLADYGDDLEVKVVIDDVDKDRERIIPSSRVDIDYRVGDADEDSYLAFTIEL